MSSKPSAKVAILLRTKDRPLFFARATASIDNQTFQDWVAVVVNDHGSRESLAASLKALKNGNRFHLLDNEESLKRDGLLQVGLEGADSEFVVVHDDDDSWQPDFLAQTVAALDAQTCGGVVANSQIVFEKLESGRLAEQSRVDIGFWMRDLRLWQMLGRNLFPDNAFLFRRSVAEAIGGYRDLSVLGDWDFNIRFMLAADVARVDGPPLANYHQRLAADERPAENTVVQGIQEHHDGRLKMLELWDGPAPIAQLLNLAAADAMLEDEIARLEQLVIPANRVAKRLSKAEGSAVKSVEARALDSRIQDLSQGAELTSFFLNARLRNALAGGTADGLLLNQLVAYRDRLDKVLELEALMAPVNGLAQVPFWLAGKGSGKMPK
jgi:hypothetical protein